MAQALQTEQEEQRTRCNKIVIEAQRAFDSHDYQDVSKLLEAIPDPLRDEATLSLLAQSESL